MKKLIVPLLFMFIILNACKKESPAVPDPAPATTVTPPAYTNKDIYYYAFTTIDGETRKLSDYKGKKIMFVNTASFCSNTPQYEKLEALYKQYASKLVIIGFPCNQFGLQEPGDDPTIKDFCTSNYQVTFPMSKKIMVKGPEQDSIYQWLTKKDLNGNSNSQVVWNFQKYLVDEKGVFIRMFENYTQPNDPEIIKEIEK